MPTDPTRAQAVFLAAADLADPAERTAFLDRECAGDAVLRHRVEALLRAHDQPDSLLDHPVVPAGGGATRTHAPAAPDLADTRTHGDGASDDDLADALSVLAPPGRADSLGRIGHYEVLEVLGRGGFGVVYRAFDDVLQRVVAVKVLAPSLAATSPARKRFLREARSSAQVRHENVVHVYAVEDEPLPYLVMEFVPGQTLQQRLDRTGPLGVPEVLRIGRQIAAGLAAAHDRGLIHRDIKPSNILIDRGPQQQVKITDFGLARAADDASLTRSGAVAGTPMYMSPEQARGEAVDPRSDLFSLGSVLYTMLTGRPPFRATTTMAVLKRVAEDDPRPIREVIPEVPEWLCRIVETLHAKDPAGRFESAREVADLLADCERQLQANRELTDYARIPAAKARPVRRPRRNPTTVVVLVLVAVFGVLALACVVTVVAYWLMPMGPTGRNGPVAGPPFERDPDAQVVGGADGVRVPRRAADVLPFLAGTWKVEKVEVEPNPPADLERAVGQMTFDFVAGGKFLRQRGAFGSGTVEPSLQGPLKAGGDVPHILFSCDAGRDVLSYWVAMPNGEAHGPVLGRFDPDSRSLLWLATFPGGIQSTHQFNFVDSNTVTTRVYNQDQTGRIVNEMRLTFTRTGGPVALPDHPVDPKRPAEMKVLDRIVGEWRNERTDSVAGPDTKVQTLRVKAEPILGGRFIEKFETDEATSASDYTLNWFDTNARKYRLWFFNHSGSVTEFTGAWNEATKTLTWNSVDGRLEGRLTFKGNDLYDFQRIVKDKDGKVLGESAGVSRRVAAGPFAVVAAGTAGRSCATLAEALDAVPAGGVVEVRGNGPFVTAGAVAQRPVTIRAAAGFRPVVEHDSNDGLNAALLEGANGLTLEGLELRNLGGPAGKRRTLVHVSAGPFAAANCRFVTASGLTRAVGAPRVDLRNCEFLSGWVQAGAVDWTDPPPKGTLRMANCVSPNWGLFLHPSQKELSDVRLEFRNNTFVGAYLMSYFSGGELLGDGKRPPPFRVTAADNVLQVPSLFRVEINPNRAAAADWPLDRVDRLARAALDWKGDRNVYLPTTGYELWHGNEAAKMGRVVKPRADWKAGWGAGDANGVEAVVQLRGPVRQKAAGGPHRLTPEDFRLADDSPGRKAGPGGKDPGADIDLVGPGAAYERWKKTPEYREWSDAGSGGTKK